MGRGGQEAPHALLTCTGWDSAPFSWAGEGFLAYSNFFLLSCHCSCVSCPPLPSLHSSALTNPLVARSCFSVIQKKKVKFHFTVLKKKKPPNPRVFKNTETKCFNLIQNFLLFFFSFRTGCWICSKFANTFGLPQKPVIAVFTVEKTLLISPFSLIMHDMTGGFLKRKYTSLC